RLAAPQALGAAVLRQRVVVNAWPMGEVNLDGAPSTRSNPRMVRHARRSCPGSGASNLLESRAQYQF
ncbi:hypothetical protein ACSLVQ_28650, partial [Klebsiella pneumoniae]|uniref:hypothetical protein n=1 Tax=Klebsiella pneumoniae TaxID=573 RepID=UPI003EE15B53